LIDQDIDIFCSAVTTQILARNCRRVQRFTLLIRSYN